jgi:hypothetical protein
MSKIFLTDFSIENMLLLILVLLVVGLGLFLIPNLDCGHHFPDVLKDDVVDVNWWQGVEEEEEGPDGDEAAESAKVYVVNGSYFYSFLSSFFLFFSRASASLRHCIKVHSSSLCI